jgi:membrane-bound inhibitor of C-type lysozyme
MNNYRSLCAGKSVQGEQASELAAAEHSVSCELQENLNSNTGAVQYTCGEKEVAVAKLNMKGRL